jgi:beta-galactosidase
MRCLTLLLLFASLSQARTTQSFDPGWLFQPSDNPDAKQLAFDDSSWRKLDLPHDWSIEGPFDQSNKTGGAGAFLPAGIGWYRKHFALPANASGQRIFIEFDGVMANSGVWINGFHLGNRPYGYVSFRYELTGHVTFGNKPNVIAVRADNSREPASRWAPGAGIYRHVRLIITDPIHVDQWATFVTTKGNNVHVKTTVVNQSAAPSTVSLSIGVAGQTAATPTQTIAPGQSADFDRDIPVPNPQLWDLDHPNLYRAVVQVKASNKTLDEDTASFGIREFHFDPVTGFWLNGKNIKIKGVCLHAELGALGATVPVGAWEHHLEILRKLGVNAIRTAHNPPAPEFLDLCDRMGFLVMDEMFDAWTVGKNPYDYHLDFREWSKIDTRDTVRRDRNHPSIMLYSAGNEIHDTPNAPLANEILRGLIAVFHENDSTRPVTQALFRPNVSHDYDNGLADLLDVVGQNYRENEILAAHAQNPARKIIGTETTMDRRAWLAARDHPEFSGQFLWAGIDYMGESRAWPVVGSNSGLIDRTGGIKQLGYERQSWWSDKPMVSITRRVSPEEAAAIDPGYELVTATRRQSTYSDWNPQGKQANVEVYSNCEDVELFLNGKSLGVKKLPADAAARTWRVDYEPGTLKAVGTGGVEYQLRTAGKSTHLQVAAAPTHDGITYVTATVMDANNVPVPSAAELITFQLTGAAKILAVDNADNSSHESFQSNQRHAYQGKAVAIIQSTGAFTITANAQGLIADKLVIASR